MASTMANLAGTEEPTTDVAVDMAPGDTDGAPMAKVPRNHVEAMSSNTRQVTLGFDA